MADHRLVAFNRFTADCLSDIRRIASHSRNEQTLLDVINEAWVVAERLQQAQDITIDFDSPEYRNTLLSFLYNKFVRYTELHVRYAVKLDHSADGDERDASHPLLNQLCADNGAHPATPIEEEPSCYQSIELNCHHSVASAYVHLLRRFDNKMGAVADYLLISVSYCYKCCARARLLAQFQRPMPMTDDLGEENEILRPWRKFRIRRMPTRTASAFDEAAGILEMSNSLR